jgi:hypothetical protein
MILASRISDAVECAPLTISKRTQAAWTGVPGSSISFLQLRQEGRGSGLSCNARKTEMTHA